ncbi:MAG: hypothetical protein VR72_08035 [Clostridiaceae bacterium BRH_c20a]|nr:MAG: hypothetical protein VR72_08035 [Clostridiaceae bacterium BRH_c20a]
MNNVQRALLTIYLPITICILILDNLYPGVNMINYIKYTIIISLFIVAFKVKKNYTEQNFMTLAIFFAMFSDFFLVFCSTIPELSRRVVPFGIGGFLIAYLILIVTYQKNFKLGWGESLAIIPVLGIFLPHFIFLYPHTNGLMFYGAFMFGFVLCYMTWTSICTIFRGYFNPRTSHLIALSGFLMFICDIGVAHAIFNPAFSNSFVPWLKNIIWFSYIPAWTLLVIIIAEKNLLSDFKDSK